MTTKPLISVLTFLLLTSVAFSQSSLNPDIQSKFDAFIQYSNAKKWDEAFSLIYPKLFSRVPKQDLVDMMTKMDQDGLSMNVDKTQITSFSVPVEEGNETFVRLTYTSDIIVKIERGGVYDAPKAIQAIDEQFKATYGGRSVQWDAEQKQFNIHATKAMMAINAGNRDWKLVEINMDQPQLMEYLFSPTIMDALVRLE